MIDESIDKTHIQINQLTIVGGELDSIVSDKGCTYMEACVHYCDKYNVEIEMLGEVIKNHQRIAAAIRKEAEAVNCLKKDESFTMMYE